MSTITGLLDTNILIDVLRGYVPAVAWMQANPELILGIPAIVRMEIVLGVQNKREQETVIKSMARFPVIYTSEFDSQWTLQQFEKFYLSHQIEILDCFIAAMSVRLAIPLYTRNIKDMSVFPNVHIVEPY